MKQAERNRVDLVGPFRRAYDSMWRAKWRPDIPFDPAHGLDFAERYRLSAPGFSEKDLRLLLDRVRGVELPTQYVEFLKACSFDELDIPWLEFASTRQRPTDWDFDYDILGGKLVSFAYEQERSGVFCFDYRDSSSGETAPIVLFRFTSPDSPPWIVGPVFSCFDAVLSVLTAVLESDAAGVPLYFETDPEPEQLQLVRRLKGMDPSGFGGPGWEARWKRFLLRGRLDLMED